MSQTNDLISLGLKVNHKKSHLTPSQSGSSLRLFIWQEDWHEACAMLAFCMEGWPHITQMQTFFISPVYSRKHSQCVKWASCDRFVLNFIYNLCRKNNFTDISYISLSQNNFFTLKCPDNPVLSCLWTVVLIGWWWTGAEMQINMTQLSSNSKLIEPNQFLFSFC